MGLHDKGVYMGYPYPKFCLCAFFGPYFCLTNFMVRVLQYQAGFTKKELQWRFWVDP